MDQETIVARLVQEFGYAAKNAPLVAEKLGHCAPPVAEAFANWWDTGVLPGLAVEGYTLEHLVSERHLNPIAALLTLDWLLKEPEKAKVILQKGHDYVSL